LTPVQVGEVLLLARKQPQVPCLADSIKTAIAVPLAAHKIGKHTTGDVQGLSKLSTDAIIPSFATLV